MLIITIGAPARWVKIIRCCGARARSARIDLVPMHDHHVIMVDMMQGTFPGITPTSSAVTFELQNVLQDTESEGDNMMSNPDSVTPMAAPRQRNGSARGGHPEPHYYNVEVHEMKHMMHFKFMFVLFVNS